MPASPGHPGHAKTAGVIVRIPMTASLKTLESPLSDAVGEVMGDIGRRARAAARVMALAPGSQKDAALAAMADELVAATPAILAANADDIADARHGGANAAFVDRLRFDKRAVAAMVEGM